MPLTIDNGQGTAMTLEELLSVLCYNFKDAQRSLILAENRLYEEEHDAEYNEFGSPREYYNPYPVSLAEAQRAYEEEIESFRSYIASLFETATFPSLDLAAHLAESLEQQNNRAYKVRTEKRGTLTALLVEDGAGDTAMVDIDTEISEHSRRNTLDDEKTVGGETYLLYSFIPPEYRKTYELYKKHVRGMLASDSTV